MAEVIIVLLLGIAALLWKAITKTDKLIDKLIEFYEFENETRDITFQTFDNILEAIRHTRHNTTKLVSIATKDNPAGKNYHEYVRADNLAKIYADYLVNFEKLPIDLAMKRSCFEVSQFGQDSIIYIINSEYKNGVEYQREQKYHDDFFSSGLIERDIKIRLEKGLIPYDLFSPIYDLIVKQQYSGKYDFQANLTSYSVKQEKYEDMVETAAIISKLEQLGILIRLSGNNWGDNLRFKLKSANKDELKRLIYSREPSHDDDHFEDKFNEGKLRRIFDASPLFALNSE